MSDSTIERIAAALDWCEEHKRLEEREKQKNRWEMEMDGLLFTNHPGDVLNKAKDMSPDVARYEQNNMEKETEKFLAIEAMINAMECLDKAREELTRAVRLVRKSK